MRVFIAIDMEPRIKRALISLQERLKEEADIKKGEVKWVQPEGMHLTLKFLGQTRDEQLAEICDAVGQAAAEHENFDLDIKSVGYFGGKSARVLWVGSGTGSEQLCDLQKSIEKKLAPLGWAKEKRKFTGHLTVCRIKNSSAGVRLAKLADDFSDFHAGLIGVDSVIVYQSRLTPTGAIYTVLGKYKLQQ